MVSGSDAPSSQVIRLNFLSEEAVSNRLDLQKVISPEKDKLETLYRLLCTLGDRSTLVFVNYRESVERVAAYLKSKKFPCDAFHGGMEQEDRERALYKFRNGSCPITSAISSWKPNSRHLSNSSITSVVTECTSKFRFLKWSFIRPGVPMMTAGLMPLIVRCSSIAGRPP